MADEDSSGDPGSPGGTLRLVTLGEASLQRVPPDGEPEEILGAGKPLALFVYLAASPGGSATRDHLVDLLWANLDLDAARHALRQALWYLRKRLGGRALRGHGGEVLLSVPVEFDRNLFLEAIEADDLERAVELYGGQFLPVFAAPGGAEFEKWADVERYRLQTHFLRAARLLVQHRLSEAAFEDARELAVRARDAVPRDQDTWRLVLETLLAAGDRVRARIEAHALEERLEELGGDLDPALAELVETARQDARPTSSRKAGERGLEPELIGREEEFAAVLSAWRACRSGRGRHVHVTSGAGLGKSRLLFELEDRLGTMGARTVCLRAHPGERNLDYALASDLAAELADLEGGDDVSEGAARSLVALNPDLSDRYAIEPERSTGGEALRHRAVALEALLEAVTRRNPLALLIDDLHWMDSASRQLIASIVAGSAQLSVLLVTTTRPEGRAPAVSADHTERLALETLTAADLELLLASLAELPDRRWAEDLPEDLYAATGGSPLLVLETLRLALDEEWLKLAGDAWECPDPEALSGELAEGRALQRRVEGLSGDAFDLLLLLCAAGRPVSSELASRALGSRPEGSVRRLRRLEVDGLVARVGEAWTVAHDEIAAVATEAVERSELREAHRRLGRAMSELSHDDPERLFRAGRHLVEARDDREVERLFARWVVALRRAGGRRPVTRLAAELLDRPPDDPEVRGLVRSLSLHRRFHLTRARKLAAAVVLLAIAGLAAGGVWLTGDASSPEISLYWFGASENGTMYGHELPIHGEALESGSLDQEALGQPIAALADLETRHPVLPDPSGTRWAYVHTVADSGDWEVFLVEEDSSRRRLTFAPADDVPMSWSPDGRHLVIQTSRWNPFNWHDLAILDLETGDVRRLTEGDHDNHDALWSPDGTRIAFRRVLRGEDPTATEFPGSPLLCRIAVDGTQERCVEAPGRRFRLVAWSGSDGLLAMVTDSSGDANLRRIDLEGRSVRVVDPDARSAVAGPDGRWVAVQRESPGRPARWHLLQSDRPGRDIVLAGEGAFTWRQISWGYPRNRTRHLERLEIRAPDTISVNVPVQLEVEGFDDLGQSVPVRELRWELLDESRALVDAEDGVLHPRRTGRVSVAASAGGWRGDTTEIAVVEPTTETVAEESWEEELERRWVPYGDPRPRIVDDSTLGRGFWNRGDRTFYSGAYSRRDLDASGGLGLRARVSTPRTAPAAQDLGITLRSWENAKVVEAWDHLTGNLPAGGASCTVKYPGGDGMHTSRQLATGGNTVELDRLLGSGDPYTLLVQLFPDGTCGVAVDGAPIARSRVASASPSAPHRVVLYGKSLDTRLLVGEVEVWTGVEAEVDWSELEGWSVGDGVPADEPDAGP